MGDPHLLPPTEPHLPACLRGVGSTVVTQHDQVSSADSGLCGQEGCGPCPHVRDQSSLSQPLLRSILARHLLGHSCISGPAAISSDFGKSMATTSPTRFPDGLSPLVFLGFQCTGGWSDCLAACPATTGHSLPPPQPAAAVHHIPLSGCPQCHLPIFLYDPQPCRCWLLLSAPSALSSLIDSVAPAL